jgi:serine/threonine protein kinase
LSQGFRERFPRADLSALDLLECMLRFDPARRITAAQALEHPFFNEIKQKGYLNSYHNSNQHLSDSGPIPLSVALNPVPMNADKEKIGESSENLKVNVSYSQFFLA